VAALTADSADRDTETETEEVAALQDQVADSVERVRLLEEDMAVLRDLSRAAAELVDVARVNASSLRADLSTAEARTQQLERELSAAYEEVEALEQDLRRMAGESVKRLRRSSLLSFVLSWASPRRNAKALGEGMSTRKSSAQSALVKRELEHNRTVGILRENITALTLSLESRELLLHELADQLEEQRVEALAK
jgi:hypothetical protein